MLRMIFSIGGRSNAGAAAVSSSGASTSAAGHVRVPRTSTAAPARAWREEDTGLPASQIESARRALDFALWDSELDFDESALPCQELYKLLRAVGVNPMEEYVNEALAAIEVRQSVDTITFGQFVHLWSYLSKGKEDEEKILSDAFNFFDRDGSGAISLEEFKAVTMELADPLSQEEVNAFIALMDENDDGAIQYTEFLHALKQDTALDAAAFRPENAAERARLREALKLEDSLSAGNGELSKALEIARIVQTSPRPRTTSLAQNTFGTEPSTSAPASGGQAYHKQDRKVRAGAALGGQDNDDERVAAPATHAMQGSEASSSGASSRESTSFGGVSGRDGVGTSIDSRQQTETCDQGAGVDSKDARVDAMQHARPSTWQRFLNLFGWQGSLRRSARIVPQSNGALTL